MRVSIALAALLAGMMPVRAIVGRATSSTNPSIVMVLERGNGRAGFCSGVVVSSVAVLTAAHCATTPADMRVHFRDASGAAILRDVAQVMRHPGYDADAVAKRVRSVDLAIVVLQEPLPTAFVPARLANASSEVSARFTIAGFGVAREGVADTAGVLREAQVDLRPPASNLLLWLAGEAGACTGDSGGPVLDADGSVVGIIAFAQGAGKRGCGALTQAVRVAPFARWIEDAIVR